MKLENYNDYKEYSVKIYDIRMSMSVLNWDQETKMPKMEVNLGRSNYLHLQKLPMNYLPMINMVNY